MSDNFIVTVVDDNVVTEHYMYRTYAEAELKFSELISIIRGNHPTENELLELSKGGFWKDGMKSVNLQMVTIDNSEEKEKQIFDAYLNCNDALGLLNGYIDNQVTSLIPVKSRLEKIYSILSNLK